MKKFILLTCVFLLTGCGVKYPKTANLKLMVPSQSIAVYTNSTAFVHGHDARDNPEVIVYKVKKKPEVKVPNLNSPIVLFSKRLTDGLREQGLQFEINSPVQMSLELNQLLATVAKSKSLYNLDAVSQVTLKTTNDNNSLTKKYNRQNNRKSLSRPKITEIEKMLNEQLSDIVTQILSDIELQKLITKK